MYNFKKYVSAKKKDPPKRSFHLGNKKRDCPKLFFNEIFQKPIHTIKDLRLKGAPMSCNEIGSITKGIVVVNDRTVLLEHGST